jgi:hypothetical protein
MKNKCLVNEFIRSFDSAHTIFGFIYAENCRN